MSAADRGGRTAFVLCTTALTAPVIGAVVQQMLWGGSIDPLFFQGGVAALIAVTIVGVWIRREFLVPLRDLGDRARAVDGEDSRSSDDRGGFEAAVDTIDTLVAVIESHRSQVDSTVTRRTRELREVVLAARATADEVDVASRAKSDLLARMSHELRTPLNGVRGALELLKGTNVDESQARYAQLIDTSSAHLERVVDDLLEFTSLQEAEPTLANCEFDLRDVLDQIVLAATPSASEKGIRLFLDVSRPLPPKVSGDRNRLALTIGHLVSNALKFTDEGEVVIAATRGSQRQIRFTISDTGIGIEPDQLGRIFQPLTQVDGSATRVHGGTGMGLTVAERLISAMGGCLRVVSHPGEGTTFWFEVVLAPSARAPEGREASGRLVGAGDGDPRLEPADAGRGAQTTERPDGARVLVADDNAMNREIMTRMLETRGYHVVVVSDGDEAVPAASEMQFDLILMDWHMSRVSGTEATRAIREHEQQHGLERVPIIGFTASATNAEQRACTDAGMDDYLIKPVRFADLERILERWRVGFASDSGRVPAPTGSIGAEPLATLRALDGATLDAPVLPAFVASFVAATERELARLEDAIAEDDSRALRGANEALRSYACAAGAKALAALCDQLATLASDGAAKDSGRLVRQIKQECDSACGALRAEVARS